MKKIRLVSMKIENFKGCKKREIEFNDNTSIFGANATGKTTILDAFFWTLFNKDNLGNSKFNIRPLDKDGIKIDNIEIKVTVNLEVNDKPISFEKLQKQNWVKKRGSQDREFQGNVNKYSIDTFPVSEKEYKERIDSIISEDVFKLTTNPTSFTALDWKQQRKILFSLIEDDSDLIAATSDSKFKEFEEYFNNGVTLEQITNKAKTTMTELKKKSAELPIRIDEASSQLKEIDVTELEEEKNALTEKRDTLREKVTELDKKVKLVDDLQEEILKIKLELNEIERKLNEDLLKERNELSTKVRMTEVSLSTLKYESTQATKDRVEKEKQLQRNRTKLESYKKEYVKVKQSTIDESKLICSLCKQKLPEDKQNNAIEEFDYNKRYRLQEIYNEAKELSEEDKILENEILKLKEKEEEYIKYINQTEQELSDLTEELDKKPKEIEVSKDKAYINKYKELDKKQKDLEAIENIREEKDKASREVADLIMKITIITGRIKMADNTVIHNRIAELQEEQQEVAQNMAEQERILYLLEELTKKKMQLLSDKINSQFKFANWIFYNTQINGGYVETCECMYNGVPFRSLNKAHQLIIGIDIINTLQKIYDVSCPIFLDNAECISTENKPTTEGQLITFYVSSHKELLVIKEE